MRLVHLLMIAAALAGCADKPSKDEQEAAKNTFVCLLDGERLVIRFDMGMARMLMPNGDRVDLYQIPAASGVRFSNGNLELRGKGTDLTVVDNNTATLVERQEKAESSRTPTRSSRRGTSRRHSTSKAVECLRLRRRVQTSIGRVGGDRDLVRRKEQIC